MSSSTTTTQHQHIPITRPYFDDGEAEAVAEVLRTGWVTQGPKVAQFEQAVADYTQARFGIATTSCTTAMHLSLYLRGIRPGDEVIMPSFTCPATANAVRHAGAIPGFAEIDPRTFNLDPARLEEAITPRTKAVMAIHQYGLPADMDGISAVAHRHGLVVIEDAGVALGASYKGRPVGSLGAPTCFSFHGRKVITTGEGGMITTDDEAFAERARVVRSHGASVSDFVRHQSGGTVLQTYEEMGFNFRMTDVQAAIGVVQMKKLPGIVRRKQELAARYDAAIADLPEVTKPFVPPQTEHSYQAYVVRLTSACRVDRRELLNRMAARNVSCRHTLVCHSEPYFRNLCGEVKLPVTDEVVETTIALPLYATMTEEEQDYVVESLRESLVK